MKKKGNKEVITFEEMTNGEFAVLIGVPVRGYYWDDYLVSTEEFEQWQEDVLRARLRNDFELADFIASDRKDAGKGVWLVRNEWQDKEWEMRQYPPLAIPDLHRKFGGLDISPEAIKHFADSYGWLGRSMQLREPNSPRPRTCIGESVGFWRNEITDMSRLLELWDLVKEDKFGALGKRIIWGRDHCVSVEFNHFSRFPSEGWTIFAHKEMPGTRGERDRMLIKSWGRGNTKDPARYYICQEINKKLRGHINPHISPFHPGAIYMGPDSLLSALYVLFALEVSGRQRPFIRCQYCGRYFPSTERSTRKFCPENDTCRKSFNRHKAKETRKEN